MLLSTPLYDKNFIAPDFTLTDVVSGETINLHDQDLSKGFVVAFISNHCPYVQEVIGLFVDITQKLKESGIPVFAIMSNNYEFVTLDNPENMKLFAQQHSFTFPYLLDESQEIAHAYDAVCTPDFFGFNSDGYMQYRGRVEELEQAMLEIAKKNTTTINQSPSRGCSIKWK